MVFLMDRKNINLIIGDIHEVFRETIKAYFEMAGFSVLYDTFSGIDIVVETYKRKPQVLIIDMELATLDGVQTAKIVKELVPELKILALSKYGNKHLLDNIKYCIDGLLVKPFPIEILQEAVIELVTGKSVFYSEEREMESIKRNLNLDIITLDELNAIHLTTQEREVIKCIFTGMSNEDISKRLMISKSTVKYHIKNILNKFQTSNRAELLKIFGLKSFNKSS